LYEPELEPGGGGHHRAEKRAVDVIAAPTQWMELTVWVNRRDVMEKPVDVKVWRDRALILRTRLRTVQPVTTLVQIPDDDKRVMIETWVSRTLRPRDFGVPDDRDLGLLVRTRFVPAPLPSRTPGR